MSDNPKSTQYQRRYLQALKKFHPSGLVIIEGKILATTPYQRLLKSIPEAPHLDKVQVYDFNEKKTDVNIASDLISDAWFGSFDQAAICSNDSDLEGALSAVKKNHPNLRIGLVTPIKSSDHRHIPQDLAKHVARKKSLSIAHIEQSQLPTRIPNTSIVKPEEW